MASPKPVTLTQTPAETYHGPAPQPLEVVGDLVSPAVIAAAVQAYLAANPQQTGYGY